MNITDVQVFVTCPGRNYVLVKIITDQPGLYGWGDATLNGRELAVASALRDHIAPLLIGRDAGRIEDTWQFLFRGTYWRGGPVLMTALAGIDLALWDIKGKQAGLPVYALLGGPTRAGALAYRHCDGRDAAEIADNIRAAQAAGYTVFRAQVDVPGTAHFADATWLDRTTYPQPFETTPYLRAMPRLFEALRRDLGDAPEILHDVHERLTPIQAARLAADLEPYRPFFLEDPVRPEQATSLHLVRQHSTTPLAMGELFHHRWDCLPLITQQLIDFIRVDIAHIGGISEARKIAAIAEAYHVQMAFHGPPDVAPITHAANVHVDMAIANFGVQESSVFPPQVAEVFTGIPTLAEGLLRVSAAPGLGIEVDEAALARYPYQPGEYLPTLRRADGSVQDW
ncbi:MAG: D-galactonate dehydratase family protein [Anaerolineae bacterium]|nr:D-galactonate dehydratase family protein [Anaerolineae bacterium]